MAKISRTSNGIERGDEISLNGSDSFFVTAVYSSENGDLVEIARDGYAEVDNLVSAEKCKKVVESGCHYCGLPAKNFNFFDELVCSECSG